MNEVWKPITGYEGKYEVSNLGNVKSLSRIIVRKNGMKQTIAERILKPQINNTGHFRVQLEEKRYFVHRLVAKEFLQNPNNYEVVNHIDCNPKNNDASNLEWCSQKQNMEYASKIGHLVCNDQKRKKLSDAHKKTPIFSINLKTGEKKKYSSIQEAAKEYGSAGNICDCCKNSEHSYKGCKFYYEFQC